MERLLQILTMGCTCGKESLDISHRRFYIVNRLGEGGFSVVDLVEEYRTRSKFAVKRIMCHSTEDEQIAMKEVEYMRNLQHTNLVGLEEAERIATNNKHSTIISEVMIVMPFYCRGTLQTEFERLRGKRIPEERILRLLQGICEGLKALHTNKPHPLAHRDMKPHNVLLDADDTPILMDFGSMSEARVEINGTAQALSLQDTAAERCSMPYRAPELFNVESHCTVDERVDIWSLGCTVYAMCFHESPFDAAYTRGDSIALAVLAGKITFPDNNTYTSDMNDLILSMLVIDPAQRPYVSTIINKTESLIHARENII